MYEYAIFDINMVPLKRGFSSYECAFQYAYDNVEEDYSIHIIGESE